MDLVTQQNASLVEQTSASSSTLASQAQSLNELMGYFTVK